MSLLFVAFDHLKPHPKGEVKGKETEMTAQEGGRTAEIEKAGTLCP